MYSSNSFHESAFLAFMMFVNYSTVFLLLRIASEVNTEATRLVQGIKREINRRNGYAWRVAKCLLPLKVMMGDSNFVEKLPPLAICSFNTENTLLCLL